ncbi:MULTISPECIES: ATP-binding cassette domain-containing protein [Spirulina sp. CCY15215]|uniref:ABC transporter ATP-binding protein n=1 Tax=Spirulina sp. CCY15215 TaxID=2767591 RepID=UPI00195103D3|nr:ATP-binding cassette domain-containing protein [Spirulina major]
MRETIIELRNVYVNFFIQKYGINSLKKYFLSLGKQKLFEQKQVLKGINLDIYKGEKFGIVGINGAGKTTLLRVLAGIIRPDRGQIKVYGRVAPLLGLGVGLELELSGRENIGLCGTLMGLSKSDIRYLTREIIEFSELGEAIDMEVKRYSSGMLARLGFAVTTAVLESEKAEILIIDEALSVGDAGFKKKCKERMDKICQSGATIILVSHTEGEMREICDRIGCMENGTISRIGNTDEIFDYYSDRF